MVQQILLMTAGTRLTLSCNRGTFLRRMLPGYDGDMVLVEIVRVMGVALGLWGAILTVPGAATRVGRDFATLGRKLWERISGRRSANMHVGAARGTITAGTPIVIGESRLPSPLEGDVSDQIEQLRQFANGLTGRISAVQCDLTGKINELKRSQRAAEAAHTATVVALKAERQRADQATLKINARGLPLIGLSILLSGLPDTWIGCPWVGWLLLAMAGLLSIVTIVRLRRPGLVDS